MTFFLKNVLVTASLFVLGNYPNLIQFPLTGDFQKRLLTISIAWLPTVALRSLTTTTSVSYTHLDVYKRQVSS